MLTKPVVVKGEPAEFILDMNDVMFLPEVLADSYFSNTHNWKEVTFHYSTEDKLQKETIIFNIDTGKGIFEVSDFARGSFLIQAIMIHDFDNGKIPIKRSSIEAELLEELDIIFS